MLTEVKGLIIRTTDIRESDRMLTIYTEEQGIVSALARGVRSVKSRLMSSTTQFCYASFVLYGQGDKLWVKEAELIDNFFDLRNSIEGLALAGYISEVLCHVATAEGDRELLRLALNSLYAISRGTHPLNRIKAVFEMRLASILGFMPEVVHCRGCNATEGEFYFDIMAGAIECYACHEENSGNCVIDESEERHLLVLLTEGAKIAIVYAIYAPMDKLFSFNLAEEDMRHMSRACEEYLLNHLGRGFKTLDFYKEVTV